LHLQWLDIRAFRFILSTIAILSISNPIMLRGWIVLLKCGIASRKPTDSSISQIACQLKCYYLQIAIANCDYGELRSLKAIVPSWKEDSFEGFFN